MTDHFNSTLWTKCPFVKLLIPFIGGIWTENFSPQEIHLNWFINASAILILVLISVINIADSPRFPILFGLFIQLVLFSTGRTIVSIHHDKQVEVADQNCKPVILILQTLSDPVQKGKFRKLTARIKWQFEQKRFVTANEKILIYFDDTNKITVGQVILVKSQLCPINNFKTVPNFDYKQYCVRHHICGQILLKKKEYLLLDSSMEKTFIVFVDELRKKILSIVKKNICDKISYGLMEALMVGYTDDLDSEIYRSYGNAGVIHIIAISGTHLALIFHILQKILNPLPKGKLFQWVRLLLILLSLWIYSLMSGASPSVIRSATLFSIYFLGRVLLRSSNLYNCLAASAFLLLCFDPGWIWDVGFQLSYLAVVSLGIFTSPIKSICTFKNNGLVLIWESCSVCLSAQILTTPLSIFYFNQFPCYFLIANLLAVPISGFIIIGGMVMCVFSFNAAIVKWLAALLDLVVKFLNYFISFVSHLPGALWRNLHLSLFQLIIVYFIIFSLYKTISGKLGTRSSLV